MPNYTGLTASEILRCPMADNESGADTIGSYLIQLLLALWREGEGFNGKRPFGNSGWQDDVYLALVNAGFITGKVDPEYGLTSCDSETGDRLIDLAIVGLLPNA